MSTAHSSINGESGEPPRKRVRKGTKSCWECKRRKIRCQLSIENVSVCSGCLTRGTTCIGQEYPEEHDTPGAHQVGERLGRVELLLEKLVAKITQYEDEDNATKIATPESMGVNDVLSPYSSNMVPHSSESAPILSLFDNEIIGRRDNTVQSSINTPLSEPPPRKTPSCRATKLDRLRQALVDLLPSQRHINTIYEESNCFLLMHAMNRCSADVLVPTSKASVGSSTFNIAEISKLHPTLIAKTLVYIAVCMQQLPRTYDPARIGVGSIEARMDKYLSTVQSLVTSDDELVATVEGLECLVLQGVFFINRGNPRRAWLIFRRALNVGQLMGIHKRDDTRPGGKTMWSQIVQADRYLALLLGLPAGSTEVGFRPEENFENPKVDKDILFNRKLCDIASRIIERNQTENTTAYAATQDIDERLANLAREMPPTWWEIPKDISDKSFLEAAEQFDHLMIQIWYYQLESLLHLPFMLRATTERRYDYSKFSCLKASREMIHRYLAMRPSKIASFCCKIVDFSVLTATVTLLLNLLSPAELNESRETQLQRENDRNLVNTIAHKLEELSSGGTDPVATQCVDVINKLLAADSPASATGNLRLTIPYFGTINIARPSTSPINVPPVAQQEVISKKRSITQVSEPWEGFPYTSMSSTNIPVVSFTSSHFPPLMQEPFVQNWQPSEEDTLFFDSLLNTDIEGNWENLVF